MAAPNLVIGTDVVHLTRFKFVTSSPQALRQSARRLGLIAQRILHPDDKEKFRSAKQSVDTSQAFKFLSAAQHLTPRLPLNQVRLLDGNVIDNPMKITRFLAGRWAIKEATRKALGARIIGFKDVRVTEVPAHDDIETGTRALKVTVAPFGEDGNVEIQEDPSMKQECLVSISHDGDYLVATVISHPLHPELRDYFEHRYKTVSNVNVG